MKRYPINIWINEERYQQLCQSGLQKLAKEVLADMKVLAVFCNDDHSTTKSIELLSVELKNRSFNNKDLDVMGNVLKEIE